MLPSLNATCISCGSLIWVFKISCSIYFFEDEKRCTPITKCSIQLILADNRKRNQKLFKSFSFFYIFVENLPYK